MKHEELRNKFFEGAPRYRWLETLGRGAVGVVFKALDLSLDDVVAIKVLSPDVERDDTELLSRFKREINLNRKIKHPNVARMFDFGISGDYPYITMEFIQGKDLWTVIDDKGRLGAAETVAILRQIARGADAIHKLGIVHRDLKSENVIVDERGAAAILDFGLARGNVNHNVTLDAVLLGTPHYMSPEQALGKKVDARSDIYSIGVIAFEMLTGRLPFTAPSPVAVAMKQVSNPLPDDLLHVPDLPDGLVDIVHRTLEKDPALRHESAEELETELALLKLSPAVQTRVEPPGRVGPPEPDVSDEVETALDSILVSEDLALRPAPALVASGTLPVGRPPSEPGSQLPLVLVVTDDVRELLKLATAVIQTGCKTLEVRNGQEALEALLHARVDLVVMDVRLPGMDGFDATRILKSQAALADVPVLLTAHRPDRSQLAFAIQSGAADLLAKPLAPAALHEAIWKILQHRGFSREAKRARTPTRVRSRSRMTRSEKL